MTYVAVIFVVAAAATVAEIELPPPTRFRVKPHTDKKREKSLSSRKTITSVKTYLISVPGSKAFMSIAMISCS